MFDHAVVGEKFVELSEKFNVTLATQSSIEKIFSLVQGESGMFNFFRKSLYCHFSIENSTVSHHWSGAISITTFAAGDDELFILQLYLTYLRRCFNTIRERVSFHLAMPKVCFVEFQYTNPFVFKLNFTGSCGDKCSCSSPE